MLSFHACVHYTTYSLFPRFARRPRRSRIVKFPLFRLGLFEGIIPTNQSNFKELSSWMRLRNSDQNCIPRFHHHSSLVISYVRNTILPLYRGSRKELFCEKCSNSHRYHGSDYLGLDGFHPPMNARTTIETTTSTMP